MMTREKLEHLLTTGMIEAKHSRGKLVKDALKAMRDRDAWKVMIAYTKKHGTCLIDTIILLMYTILGANKSHNPYLNLLWVRKYIRVYKGYMSCTRIQKFI